MGFLQPSTIHQLAESLAVPKLSSDAAKSLAPHIDVRLREIVQAGAVDSTRVNRRLSSFVAKASSSSRERPVQPRHVLQEACKFLRHSKRKTLTTEDINHALRARSCQPLYGFGGRDPARFVRAAGHPDLFYLEDLELPTAKLIEAPLPKVPVEVGVVPHWLAIEGVQPNVPENTPLETPKQKRPRPTAPIGQRAVKQKTDAGPAAAAAAAGSQGGKESGEAADPQQPVTVVPPVRLVLSSELLRVFDNLKEVLSDAKAMPDTAPGGPFAGWPGGGQAASLEPDEAKHTARERHALQCLAHDPGQHPLAPATIELITEQVRACMKQLPQLHLLIKVARSMLRNRDIDVERYLDRLLSPLMTCILTRRLGSSPTEDHWSVRSAAADVIAETCARFGNRFPNLPGRIAKQYVSAFMDRSKALPCQYGAVVGLTKLGHRTVQLMLLPYAKPYLTHLEKALAPTNPNEVQRMEARHVYGAIMHACASCMYASMTSRLSRDFFAHLKPLGKLSEGANLDFKGGGLRGGVPKLPAKPRPLAAKRKHRNAAVGSASATDIELANGNGNGIASAASPAADDADGRDLNPLSDAWREDARLGEHLLAVHELFEEAVQPYVPAMPISHVFL